MMKNENAQQQELSRFVDMWDKRPPTTKRHTRELWNERAERWEQGLQTDEVKRRCSEKRVAATAAFLREHGLLTGSDTVIDIGCGPGRFVAEFAKTAKHVTGTDLSEKMVQFGTDFAKAQNISNVSFTSCDFKKVDIDALGWRNAFDLVFTYITPAISSISELEKAISMSRGWCFNGNFVRSYDALLDDIVKNVFNRPYYSRFDGKSSYALFNMLWLKGYFPYVSYYSEISMDKYVPERQYAAELAENVGIDRYNSDAVERIYRYLSEKAERQGELVYPYEKKYIWLLWDTQVRVDR